MSLLQGDVQVCGTCHEFLAPRESRLDAGGLSNSFASSSPGGTRFPAENVHTRDCQVIQSRRGEDSESNAHRAGNNVPNGRKTTLPATTFSRVNFALMKANYKTCGQLFRQTRQDGVVIRGTQDVFPVLQVAMESRASRRRHSTQRLTQDKMPDSFVVYLANGATASGKRIKRFACFLFT